MWNWPSAVPRHFLLCCCKVFWESTVTPWKLYASTLMRCGVPRVYRHFHGSCTPPRSCTVVFRESADTLWKLYTSTLMRCSVPRVYSHSMEAVHLHTHVLQCSERLVTPWKMYTSTVLSTVSNQPSIFKRLPKDSAVFQFPHSCLSWRLAEASHSPLNGLELNALNPTLRLSPPVFPV